MFSFSEIMGRVRKGVPLRVDLVRHTYRLGKEKEVEVPMDVPAVSLLPAYLFPMSMSEPQGLLLIPAENDSTECPMPPWYVGASPAVRLLRYLYAVYRHSVPSEREARNENRAWFKCSREPTREDMIMGIPRTEARAELELAALVLTSRGMVKVERGWFVDLGHGLIIKKAWCL